IGGIKQISAQDLNEKKPGELIRKAVRGMLPKNTLGRSQLKKLKVYAGATHPHEAQQPEPLAL
ncbi:MAG: uL13 family ribosomal protein, partial [Desulfobulbaceae bacterium]|nr:uL13 family ribosomal protein [Desulfobulbaceae bacterium]